MIAGLVEGAFGRIFRSQVRPMELARKLVREMDEHRTVSLSRVYAPSEYAVWLSPQDRARYEGVEDEVIDDLCAYLLEHARAENLVLASRPDVSLHTDERLALGEFGVSVVERAGPDPPVPSDQALAPGVRRPRAGGAGGPTSIPFEDDERGHTMIYSTSRRLSEPLAQTRSPARTRAVLVVDGRRLLVPPDGGVIGRSRDCAVVLADAGVSRHHASLQPTDGGWQLEDLDSTNGIRVNGRRIHEAVALQPGDRIEIGSTEIGFQSG
jgi:Protein of unknown function (DUF3662)/FHA domain